MFGVGEQRGGAVKESSANNSGWRQRKEATENEKNNRSESTAVEQLNMRMPKANPEAVASGKVHLCRDVPVWKSEDKNADKLGALDGNRMEECKICGKHIPKGLTIAQHLDMLQPLIGAELTCQYCWKSGFIEPRALAQHELHCRARG